MTAAAAESTWDEWLPLTVVLGGIILLAVAVGQLWQLEDRGDGRGDMAEASQEDPEVPAGSLYVRCGLGTGDNSGSSHDNAFQSWTAARTASKTLGQDMYFLSGTTCDVGTAAMNAWSGIESDRAVLGSYYMDGATPRVGVEGGRPAPGVDAGNKPTLQSTFTKAACSAADSCTLIGLGYTGLINIFDTNDFTVQDVEIKDWAGRGVDTDAGTKDPGNRRIIVDNVHVRHVAREGILGKETHEWLLFYDNSVINAGSCTEYSYTGCETRPGSLVMGFDQGRADRGIDARNLIEGNYVSSAKAEGIGAYGAENVLVRGNVVAATWSASIYMDGTHNVVVENNIVNGDINETFVSAARSVTNMAGGYEAFLGNRRDVTAVFRNNFAASQSGLCFNADNENTDEKMTRYVYGNTCAHTDGYTSANNWPNNDVTLFRARSNIFYSQIGSSCTGHGSNSDFDYNAWDQLQGDGDCIGANDVIGNPNFAQDATILAGTGPADTEGNGGVVFTDFSAAAIAIGSLADGAGDPAGETALCDINATTLPFEFIRHGSLDQSSWEKCLYYDALGNVRDPVSPSAGALNAGAL